VTERLLGRSPLATALLASAPIAAFLLGRLAAREPKMAVAALVGLLLLALAFLNLTVALIVFILLTFFEHLPNVGGDVTIVKAFGAMMALTWMALAIDPSSGVRLLPREAPLLSAAAVAFVGWSALSILWAADVGIAASETLRLVQVVILFFLTFSAIREPRHLRAAVWAYCTGVFLTTGYGLTQGLAIGGDRLIGGILDPNFLAAALVAAIVLAIFLAFTTHGFPRFLALAYMAVYLPALFFTQSRGGVVALAAAFVVALFVAGPLRGRIFASILVMSAIAVTYFVFIAPAASRQRISDISASGSAGRVDEWRIAFRMINDHPVAGVGLGNFRTVEPQYLTSTIDFLRISRLLEQPQTHNTYLQAWSELGTVGLALLLALLGGTLLTGLRGVRRLAAAGDRETEILGRGLLIALVGLLAAFAFLPALDEKQLWLLLGLTAALWGLERHADTAGEPPPDANVST
jgi:O-antigen ligase